MINRRQSRRTIVAFVGVCIIIVAASLLILSQVEIDLFSDDHISSSRRFLQSITIDEESIYSYAEKGLIPVTEPPNPKNEVSLFWHIPKSGGTTAKSIYECLNLIIANRAGGLAQFGYSTKNFLLSFHPWGESGPSYVNADTTSFEGIDRAERLRLVPAHKADIIFTSYPEYAISHLYNRNNKGRAMGLFRHPINRLVSKFYYLQIADWERSYKPQWKDMSVSYWARHINNDNEHMVKKLAGKRMNDVVDEEDLQLAMRTLKSRFVVGLMDNMEESIHRFNTILGIDETLETSNDCMDQYFGHGSLKSNSNSHPKVSEGSEPWKALAESNPLDIKLYEFIVKLFEEQRELIESYSYR